MNHLKPRPFLKFWRKPTLSQMESASMPKALYGSPMLFAHACCALPKADEILREINVGSPVFACMLGGHDGRTLFACTAPTFDEVEAARNHQASVITTVVDVPRAGLP